MLPQFLIDEIVRQLSAGQSHRTIAAKLGVSRGVVGALSTGRRDRIGREAPQVDSSGFPAEPLAPERCPTCGGRVYLPCVVCRAERFRSYQKEVGLHSAFDPRFRSRLRIAAGSIATSLLSPQPPHHPSLSSRLPSSCREGAKVA